MRASSPSASKPFFSLLCKPGRRCRPDCRYVGLCNGNAVSLRRNERERDNAAARKPARFSRRKNSVPPQAQPSNNDGSPITQSVIARVKRAKKEPERRYASLLAISEEPTLFPIACPNKPTKNCLSGGAWGGALGPKAASPTSPSPHSALKHSSGIATNRISSPVAGCVKRSEYACSISRLACGMFFTP